MRSLNKIFRPAVLEKKDVKAELNKYLLMYRSMPHSVLGKVRLNFYLIEKFVTSCLLCCRM